MPGVKNDDSERELKFSRVLNAPVKLVWEVLTNPEHLKNWWGPDGFANTIKKMDVKPGGELSIVMHDPDSSELELDIQFIEIIRYKRIVYKQYNHFRCTSTIELERLKDKTLLNWTMLFESKEFLLESAKTYGVVSGLQQCGERLVTYILQFKNQEYENH